MKNIITVQHTQSVHHTNGMVGSWTDWELTEIGKQQADNIGRKCCGKTVQWLRDHIECQEKTIDDKIFSDAESRRDEWNRLKPFFDSIMADNSENIIIVSHGDL